MSNCKSCGAALGSALVCEACGALQRAEAPLDPWAVLGLPVGFALDAGALRKRLLALQRRMHPDFFGGADAELRALAERNTAELNAAERLLSDDVRRADLLVKRLEGPDEQKERQMPPAFLAEVLEWNEVLEEARAAPPGVRARAVLDGLEQGLRSERGAALAHIAAQLVPLPAPRAAALGEVRRELNAVRYLDRTLATLSELRLEQARSTR